MMNNKPTLQRYLLRQHLLAASLTTGVMLVLLLLLADHLTIRAASQSLAKELRAGDAVAFRGMGRRGRLVLDERGLPLQGNGQAAGRGWGMGAGRGQQQWQESWPLAEQVLEHGEMTGFSALPWLPETVVWAARADMPRNGERRIWLIWTPLAAIRAAAGPTYLMVVAAITIAFIGSLLFTARAGRMVTEAVTDLTGAGKQMVDGNFAVQVSPQRTRELAELRDVITELAVHLDHTLRDLRAEHDRLQRLEGAQRQFVADASHELRAPLSAMTLTLDAWHDGLLLDHERPEAVDYMRDELKRLNRMVAQLLDLSRIEAGRHPLELDTIDVAEACAQAVRAVSGLPGPPVKCEVQQPAPLVLADRDALHRILRNLLENALRFTPREGNITLQATREAGSVCLTVIDNGPGIPADVLPRVWDRFARAEQTRADNAGGSGLGLAIVKALVELMGGSVTMESDQGAGTTVRITLQGAENVREE